MTDDLQPLFAVLSAATRPYAAAIQAQPSPVVVSSWIPQDQPVQKLDDGSATKRAQELADAKAAAIEEGRAQGLAETAALRETLTKLATELAAARTAQTAKTAETIADCAIAAIEGWLGAAPKQELLAPAIAAWITRAGSAPAIAKVHPSNVAIVQAAIGDAPITVEADAAMAQTDIKIRGESLDATHAWPERLRALRDVIATALETA